jgi:hypothetical protein
MGRKRCGYLTYVKEGIENKLQKDIRHFALHPDVIIFCERLVIFLYQINVCDYLFLFTVERFTRKTFFRQMMLKNCLSFKVE